MPDLNHTLQGHDLGFLKIVSAAWGIELDAPDVFSALPVLQNAMLDRELLAEVVEALPKEARNALQVLLENDGLMSWAVFTRRFGEVRVMGAARRDRERPDLKPISAAEILWYRALVGKDFLNLPPEPQEYAYLPEDLVELLQPRSPEGKIVLGRAASPGECAQPIQVTGRIIDDACSYLAAVRSGMDWKTLAALHWSLPLPVLDGLLRAAGLLDQAGMPQPEAVRSFLAATRPEVLALLTQAWLKSPDFNELCLLPDLKCEGEWHNNPLQARQAILDMLSHLPQDHWWSLKAFVEAIHENYPDFQRPAGDYDSWFIRQESTGAYLRGFAYWDQVDGALVRFLVTGPLHWLGVYDLAAPSPGATPTAFRPSQWAASLWNGNPPPGLPDEKDKIHLSSDGQLVCSPLVPRLVRYQIARYCLWEETTPELYRYRLTPASIERAKNAGLPLPPLLRLLQQHSSPNQLPPELRKALGRLEKFGPQTSLERATLLRVSSPEVLKVLCQSSASRFLEELSPTTAIVKPGNEKAVRKALAEAGYLADVKFEI